MQLDLFGDGDEPSLERRPLLHEWGEIEGLDVEIHIHLARPPLPHEAASLEDVIREWDRIGIFRGYGGHLHGLYVGERFGPRWEGSTLRWFEDVGSADGNSAAAALTEALSAWSARTRLPVVRLRLGR